MPYIALSVLFENRVFMSDQFCKNFIARHLLVPIDGQKE